ncbi:MAG: MIP/aquaporin family protein, partial [Chloroflexus sp.]
MPASFLGELFGTMVLILFGNGVVANVLLTQSKGNGGGWIVITAGWAFGVMSGVFTAVALGSPGADLNPAVTIAVMLRGGYDVGTAVMHIIAQFIGAFIGAILVWLTYLSHWEVTKDPGLKLACFSTGPAISNPVNNIITEVIGTFALVFIIFAIFSANGATGGS